MRLFLQGTTQNNICHFNMRKNSNLCGQDVVSSHNTEVSKSDISGKNMIVRFLTNDLAKPGKCTLRSKCSFFSNSDYKIRFIKQRRYDEFV
jgi:hypothetical protein